MKRLLTTIARAFELGDHESILASFEGRYPFRAWVTKLDRPSLFRYRLRCGLASLLINRLHRRCVRCGRGYTVQELVARDESLVHYMSGTINHRACVMPPQEAN